MTDIQRQFKHILKLLRTELSSQTWTDDSISDLRLKLADLLPQGYGLGAGRLTDDNGKFSEPISIIIYDRPLSDGAYSSDSDVFSINHTLLVLEIVKQYTLSTFQAAMHRMASVKSLKSLPSKTKASKRRQLPFGQRREKIPKSRLPVGMMFFVQQTVADPNDEAFVQHMSTCLGDFPLEQQPDYVYFTGRGLFFRNALLDGDLLTGYEIGFLQTDRIRQPQQCYVCKEKYFWRHFFYQFLCPSCGDFNYHKRHQSADLSGRIALVTGGRIKIGFQVVLRLLGAGAQVIVTSRFPHDAAHRYSQIPDFETWRDRLHIVGLDLRHTPSVEAFIAYLYAAYSHLDILVNNAAQTVRRPPEFYAHLIPFEQQALADLPPQVSQILLPQLPTNTDNSALEQLIPNAAQQSQFPLTKIDTEHDDSLFPKDRYDSDGQQIDNRDFNTWLMRLDEVPMPEMVEVHLVNAVAPGLLAGGLRDLMTRSPNSQRYIVNVSSIEGQFASDKRRGLHPHTNMAKAALNMLTRSIAEDYAQSGIFVNSVDPGWVSDQFPRTNDAERAAAITQLPIDMQDAAARVCDVIFSAENGMTPQYGQFFKNYQLVDW